MARVPGSRCVTTRPQSLTGGGAVRQRRSARKWRRDTRAATRARHGHAHDDRARLAVSCVPHVSRRQPRTSTSLTHQDGTAHRIYADRMAVACHTHARTCAPGPARQGSHLPRLRHLCTTRTHPGQTPGHAPHHARTGIPPTRNATAAASEELNGQHTRAHLWRPHDSGRRHWRSHIVTACTHNEASTRAAGNMSPRTASEEATWDFNCTSLQVPSTARAPHRHHRRTATPHGAHGPPWHRAAHACPHGIGAAHTSGHVGSGSRQDMRGRPMSRPAIGVLPQGQVLHAHAQPRSDFVLRPRRSSHARCPLGSQPTAATVTAVATFSAPVVTAIETSNARRPARKTSQRDASKL